MAEGSSKFDEIMMSNFTEAEIAALPKFPSPQETESDEQVERDRAERIYHASLDPRIGEYILSGEGKDVLIAQLKFDYDLTEEEARRMIADVEYKAGDLVDYGDEA